MSILKEIAEGRALLEVSNELKARYAIKAASSKRDHIAKGTRHLAMANSMSNRAEPEVKEAEKKAGRQHLHKAANRHAGIERATSKMKCESLDAIKHDIAEHARRGRGRPKKPRHEDGKPVNDPDANL